MQENYLAFSFAFDRIGKEWFFPDFGCIIFFAHCLKERLVALGLHHKLIDYVYVDPGLDNCAYIQAIF